MDLVWDFDYIKYTIAAVCEKRTIKAIHNPTGNEYDFKTRTELWGHHKKKAGGWLAEHNKTLETPWLPEEFTIVDVQTPEPVSYALSTVKNHINNVCEKIGKTHYYGYIGKGDSWRVEKSTILKYKGQRENLLKPLLLDDIEEYLRKHHDAIEVREFEADDQCVIDCTKNPELILVGVDKDYLGTALTLFNPDKMAQPMKISGLGKLYIDEKGDVRGHGRKFFYFQVLSGDDSDNYCANSASDMKWGEKAAFKLLEPCKTDAECWQALVDGYKTLYPEKKVITGWRGDSIEIDWKYVLNENCHMAHMLRHEKDFFDLDAVLERMKVKI